MTSRIDSVWEDFSNGRVTNASRDLQRVPVDIETLQVQTKGFADWRGLAARRRLRRLSMGPVGAEHVGHLADLDQLESLWIRDVRIDHIGGLARLSGLRDLVIRSAPKLSDVSAISRLSHLQTLWLWDLPRLADLDVLAGLRDLRELRIETAPSRDSRGLQRVPSLAPLSHLARLERLHLVGIGPQDERLYPLHGLAKLRHVHLPNAFPLAEFAALAGARTQARGNFAEPVWTVRGLPACRKCGTEKVILLGVGTRLKCPSCDAAAIDAHVAEFERLRRAGVPGA